MKIVGQNDADVREIAKIVREGGLVIYPTETVYGAGVDATNAEAVKRLSKYKTRPLGKPYSIAVTNREMAEKYAQLNPTADNLYKNWLPGPVTIVSRGKHKVAPGVESETGTLGIRIPDYPMVTDIVRALGRPITATSANASYQKRPYKLSDIWDNISNKQKDLIDLAIDAGELPHNEPSTVIDTTLDDVVVLRLGEIKLKDRNEVVSRSEEDTQNIGKELWQSYESHAGQRAIVFALEGELGSGKTVFTKGLARAMGIKEEVVSPTFNLELDYEGRLIHIDAWRMQTAGELDGLGFGEMIHDKSVLAVEWADRVAETIRKYNEEAVVVWVKIEYGKRENERIIGWGSL